MRSGGAHPIPENNNLRRCAAPERHDSDHGAGWAGDRAWFLAYVQQVLSSTPRRGKVVILDNLPVHKITSVREAVEATDAKLLFLPPYSTEFNHR